MNLGLFESLLQDLRFATRGLRRTPLFTMIAVCSLALGIGANTAIFSFVNAILLKSLPVPEPNRLVRISEYAGNEEISSVFSYPFITEVNKRNTFFDGVLGRFGVRVNLTSSGVAEPLDGEIITGEYFKTLQIRPALGRLMTEDDIDAAANPVCVISYSMWQDRFRGDPHIISRKLLLNHRPYAVIGVTQQGFYGSSLQSRIDIQLPVSRMGDFMGGFLSSGPGGITWKSAGFTWLQLLARLKPGITPAEAQAMLQPLAREIRIQIAYPADREKIAGEKRTDRVLDGSQGANDYAHSEYAKPLTVLMGVVGLVLLIACMNLANLLLARANAREKEFAIRLSLGASRFRLIRQLMLESLAIAVCGGVLGLVLSFWIIETLLAYLNSGKSAGAALHATPDPLVIGFCIGLSLLTAVLFGLAPAWQSAKREVLPELKDVSSAVRTGRDRSALRKSLIAVQIALSLVILFAAGLLTRTLSRLQTVDLGFQPAHVIALSVDPAMNGYSPAETDRIFDEILGRLRALPQIKAASLATVSPLEGGMIALDVEVPGHMNKKSDIQADFNMVSPGYFATLGQPLLLGRDFSDHDVRKAPQVAIVNQRFLSQYMPVQNPIGRHFKAAGGDVEIVGVVRNARYQSVRETFMPLAYLPAKQTQSSGYTLLVQTSANPRAAIAAIEHTIRAIDSKLPIYDVRTLQAQIDQGISSERVLSFLSALFSGLATLLCGIGLYGIVAYAVSRRTREIGVRFAVGAQKSDVAKLFLRESVIVIAAGILIGMPIALVSTRVLKSLLYGLQPTDLPTLAFTIAILVAAGLLATLLPVRRAARIEPLEALRYQ